MSLTRKEAIVMDVDQVLLDHLSRFREFVNKKYNLGVEGLPLMWNATEWLNVTSTQDMIDLFTEFSQSYEFGTLDSFPGADVVLHELLREGYSLICVTACGSDPITEALRRANLFHRFGDIFTEIHFTELTGSKSEALKGVQDRYDIIAFVDDKPENIHDAICEVGIENCVLMKAPHNRDYRVDPPYPIALAYSWYDCKKLINEYSESI